MHPDRYRLFRTLWIALVLCATIGLLVQGVRGLNLRTSVFDLIPSTDADHLAGAAYDTFVQRLAGRIVIVVEGPNFDTTVAAADEIVADMNDSDLFSEVTGPLSSELERDFFELLFPYRFQLFSADNETLAAADDAAALLEKSMHRLYQPMLGIPGDLIVRDPFFLFVDLATSLPRVAGQFAPMDGWLIREQDGRYQVLLTAAGHEDSFGGDAAQQIVDTLERSIRQVLSRNEATSVQWTGMVKYAADAAGRARREMSLIGTGSLVGIVLLLLFSFRSLKIILVSMVPIATGLLFSVSLTHALFGQIHLMTLVFGASLVGVCIDYSFHYLAHRQATPDDAEPLSVLRAVLPGITMGFLTSIAGYAALSAAPFPGLRQMAVFAVSGLVGAFGAVVFWYPRLCISQVGTSKPLLWRIADGGARRFTRRVAMVCVGLGLLSLPGILWLKADDDVRLLRPSNPVLEAEETEVNALLGGLDRSRFIVVQGESAEQLAENERRLTLRLREGISRDLLGGFLAVSDVIPPVSMQRRNLAFVDSLLRHPETATYLDALGLTPADVLADMDARPRADVTFADVATRPSMSPWRMLWLGRQGDRYASVVILEDVADTAAMRVLVESLPSAHYVDKVTEVSSLFARYRVVASRLLVGAYVLVFLGLLWRYGPHRAVRVILPPMITAAVLLGGMGFLGIPVNLFTFLAFMLVLAIGIDYTLFFAEAREDVAPTAFAVALSMITTLLAFGLLFLSSTPAMSHLGGVILVGIVLAAIMSPMAAAGERRTP